LNQHQPGRVAALFRYPVKSMRGESVASIEVGWNGFVGDRRWAFVRDGMTMNGFPWLTIRQRPELALHESRLLNPDDPEKTPTIVKTPAGEQLDVADPRLADALGNGARVIRQSRGIFDALPLSLISRQTVAALSAETGLDLDVRRFRPNIVVDAPGDGDFPEVSWVGKVLRIGGFAMRIDKRDKRCVVVTVDPYTAEKSPEVLATIRERHEQFLGVYGSVVEPGVVAVGDTVTLEA
jgi:uncharacterized protein YcbX